MLKFFSIPTLAVVLFFSLLGTSCQKKERSSQEQIQCVHLNLSNEPATLDPRKGGDIISSHLHFLLFEGLVRLNQDDSITPALAKSFEISADGTVYTFFLRDAMWSNRTPITAFDFEKSWKDMIDPSFPCPNAHLLYPIKNAEAAKQGKVPLSEVGIIAKDDKTLIVTLEKPIPYFLDLVSFCVFFPINQQIDKEYPDWALHAGKHYVSNGPYILKEWKHNNEIIVMKNPLYWDQDHIQHDTIHFSMIDNEMTALQMFENGELDMLGDPISPLPVDALLSLKKKNKIHVKPVGGTMIISFNVDAFPLTNEKIRKAFAYAIDRKSIVKNITQMDEIVATNAIPPILKNHRNRLFFKDGDIGQAQLLLQEGMKELGITKNAFENIVYYYTSSERNHKIAQAIQQQWHSALGLHIKIESLDNKVLMDKLMKRDFAFGQCFWFTQYNDQMNIFERFKSKMNSKNYSNWENSEFIRLLEASFYENGLKRAEILEKAEEIFLNEMPICPLYHCVMSYIVQPHLNDVGITSIGDLVFETPKS
jgi:oligopeptide transport system substrate-binding protein